MIKTETRGRVATIELARPDKKNALTAAMYAAMTESLAAAEADPEVRAILIHGTHDCFTAGNDLKDFLQGPAGASQALRFVSALSKVEKPAVAAVGGPAVGIGTTLLLHCDLVYAAPGARFQLPFVHLGLVPEAASSLLLPMAAGYQRAAAWLLLGQAFTADEALAAGIVIEIVPPETLIERARAAATALAALPPESVRLTKQLMKRPLAAAVAEQMAEEARLFSRRLQSAEAKEAMTAFLEKRKPDFSRY
ncbi:MAG TPA: enoyl-CoA hydratase [Burkholderiales bacterium]|nr:enoyl-CoA hydratase [Burkholderiales bacterium]